MAALEDHVAFLVARRESLLSQIDALPEGERKMSLRERLADIDTQIAALVTIGDAATRFAIEARY